MEGSPVPGWYADPADASRHRYWDGSAWTTKTRSATGAIDPHGGEIGRPRTGLWIGLGLLAVFGIGIASFLLLRSGEDVTANPDPSEEADRPAPISTTDPSEVVVPEDWSLYTSETGVMSYAVDPVWEDLLSAADQDYIHSVYSDMDDSTSEYSGAWLLDGSAWQGGTAIYVITYSDGTQPSLLRYQATSFAHGEVDEVEIILDEEYINARGYEGWRLDYRATVDDVSFRESVIMLKADTTLVIIWATTDQETAVYVDEMLAVADSIVVHHPPAEG